MSENLANRVGRLVAGSFNALVDAVENAAPETVMEEAIRELDGAITEVRAELGREVANKHLANKRLGQENSKHEDLGEQISVALEEGRDDLAEAAISRQLDIEAQIPVLEQRIADCAAREKELEGFITALLAKKRSMQEELREYREAKASQKATTTSRGGIATAATSSEDIGARVDNAANAFQRVIERQTGLRSIPGKTDEEGQAKLAELEDITRKNRIQERLMSAKAQLAKN